MGRRVAGKGLEWALREGSLLRVTVFVEDSIGIKATSGSHGRRSEPPTDRFSTDGRWRRAANGLLDDLGELGVTVCATVLLLRKRWVR
jgi:hypothetical protein